MANVHVGIMVNIVTLIVITVFCKISYIIMNIIIIIIIKGKTILCCKEDNICLFDYISNSALSVQPILCFHPPSPLVSSLSPCFAPIQPYLSPPCVTPFFPPSFFLLSHVSDSVLHCG